VACIIDLPSCTDPSLPVMSHVGCRNGIFGQCDNRGYRTRLELTVAHQLGMFRWVVQQLPSGRGERVARATINFDSDPIRMMEQPSIQIPSRLSKRLLSKTPTQRSLGFEFAFTVTSGAQAISGQLQFIDPFRRLHQLCGIQHEAHGEG